MFKIIHILFLSFLFMSCGKEEEECTENIDPDCACIALFDPVCGCNNKTYGNSCEATCSGIDTFSPGECP